MKVKFSKRLLTALFCAMITISCALTAFASEDKSETLTVGVPVDRCPIIYRDHDTGEITGIGVELLRTAAENAGYTPEFKELIEKTVKDAIDNEDYDILLPFGSAIKSSSGQNTVVSDNLLQTPFTLVTDDTAKKKAFNELTVGMPHSLQGAADTVKQLYPGIGIEMYDNMNDCVNALRDDKVDALLHNSYVWSYVLQKPSYSDLKVQPSAMFSMDFRAGALDTPKGRAIIERLNKGIAGLSDPLRHAVILDFTSRKLYRYDFSDYIYTYGVIILLGALLTASITIITLQKIRSVRREHEEKMRRLIDQDPLTGVLSFEGFRKRVPELLKNNPDIPYLLAYTNIKDFKYINDSLGRAAGDELLKFWAEKTVATLTDKEAVARDGDHFLVLRRMEGEEKVIRDDKEVVDSVRNYFIDRGKENRIRVCGGIYVLTPGDYAHADVDHMLDFARVAEKRLGETMKDGYEFYNPDQWEKGKRAAYIISHLRTAIETGEIEVWYQPQVDYGTGRIKGAEALCRWNHSMLGRISPGEFIPMLEEAGMISELDLYVWETVCRDLSRWNSQGIRRSVSVNLSRNDIKENKNIPELFISFIHNYGLSSDQFRIEITETSFVEDSDLLIKTTERLRDYGFHVEMDDFGSGYSSLHMLKEVPVNCIKLDLHFLTQSGDPEKSRTIVSYMVQMVKSLGMELIAEGVETDEQARFLHSKGCSNMQGYYFYKPMPVEDFEGLSVGKNACAETR